MKIKILKVEAINDTLDLKVDVRFENGSLGTYTFHCCEMTHTGWQDVSTENYPPSLVKLIDDHRPNWTDEIKTNFKKQKEFEYSKMLSAGFDQQIPEEEINAILASI